MLYSLCILLEKLRGEIELGKNMTSSTKFLNSY